MVKYRGSLLREVVELPFLKTQIDTALIYLTRLGLAWIRGFQPPEAPCCSSMEM